MERLGINTRQLEGWYAIMYEDSGSHFRLVRFVVRTSR